MNTHSDSMGGKDSPPPFAQQPQQQLEQDHKMAEIHSLERSYCTLSLPRSTASTPSLSLRRESSPIQYVPKSKSAVNVQRHGSSSTLDGSGSSTLPRSYTSSGSGSPVRTYMECLSPQSLKVVLVGDSCVGKTSMKISIIIQCVVCSPRHCEAFEKLWPHFKPICPKQRSPGSGMVSHLTKKW